MYLPTTSSVPILGIIQVSFQLSITTTRILSIYIYSLKPSILLVYSEKKKKKTCVTVEQP